MIALHLIQYFLITGLSAMTYWNLGKQLFNLFVWPDDSRQLIIQLAMILSTATMFCHVFISIWSKLSEIINISLFFLHCFSETVLYILPSDWFLVSTIVHPAISFYIFPRFQHVHMLTVWFSFLMISVKFNQKMFIKVLGVFFIVLYSSLLESWELYFLDLKSLFKIKYLF